MAFDRLETEEFWRELVPDLTVRPDPADTVSLVKPSEAASDRMLSVFDREGYVKLPRSQDPDHMAMLAQLVEGIRGNGLPPVFSFIYDEMWQPYRRLGPIIECLLRGQNAMMPNIWAWHVDPRKGEAGWKPHRDLPGRTSAADPFPKAVTVWIPITEATPLNGCMYVVPKHRDGLYGQPSSDGLSAEMADIRALPATPGESLIWTHDLVHWGSHTSELGTAPRMSMSIEFQRFDVPPFSEFVIRPDQPPTFEQKLALIGRAIVKYQHMHAHDPELTNAAIRWARRIPIVFGEPALQDLLSPP